ncbi:MAG: hypothetical protein ASARMPREDX12_007679 [Alectoria sarmentosa]|nr:MAG: hypothetical protein ASARMPREDX12_007679 [Alectoria sarmentosa]
MLSLDVALIDSESLQSFCLKHEIVNTSLFKLSWALILHRFFESSIFLVRAENANIRNGGVCYENCDALSTTSVVEYRSELAKETVTYKALQRNHLQPRDDALSSEKILREGLREAFDGSTQKIWTALDFCCTSLAPAALNESLLVSEKAQIVVKIESLRTKLSARLVYDDNMVTTFQAECAARALGTAVQSMISGAEHVADVNILGEYDMKQIFAWNAPQLLPVEDCLHHLVERSVSKNPDAMAILSWDGTLTYEELDQLSSRLAHHFIDKYHIGLNKIIPLCFEKSMWAVVAMLAILKCGASYACMDPTYPPDRRIHILGMLDADLMVTSPLHRELREHCTAIVIDANLLASITTAGTSPNVNVEPTSACIVAFTSGSTGNPKGFVHEHVSICTGMTSNACSQGLKTNSSRVFQWAAYTFDVSITEIYAPLIYGGCVCIPSEEERLNNVEECMRRMEVNWSYFTPSFARFFQRYSVPTLKTLIMGGEVLTSDDVKVWVNKVRVLNAYGPAESANWWLEPQTGDSDIISIGRPTVNMLAWVADPEDHNRLLPLGAIGELLLEGPGLFRGYLHNPEQNKKSLIEPPLWRRAAESELPRKMYKTGDLVRYLPDGKMIYMGRKDTMVKLRGQRMELGEVEIHLRRNLPEFIHSAADVIRPAGDAKDPVLVAFLYIPEDTQAVTLAGLSAILQTQLIKSLPVFMVPRIYVPVPSMPYNASRKLDRAKLRQYASSLTLSQLLDINTPLEVERNETQAFGLMETIIGELWADALQSRSSTIDAGDNFFALGGTSMAALKVTASARDRGVQFSYLDMFRTASLSALASIANFVPKSSEEIILPLSLVKDSRGTGGVIADAVKQCGIAEESIEDLYPLAPQQEGLWALSLVQSGDYVAQFILTLKANVDVEKFRAAWESVVNLLPIFRSRFTQSDSGSYQVIVKGSMKWQIASSLEEYLREDRRIAMALGDPLTRHALVTEMGEKPQVRDTANGVKDGRTIIVCSMHHALFDGESTPLFLNAVAQAYKGTPPDIKKIAPFNSFVGYLQKLDDSASTIYWRSQFDSISPVEFPSLPSPTHRPNPKSAYKGTIQFARKLGSRITTPTVLQAAWALTLAQVTQCQSPTFGITLAGRSAPVDHIESLIGPTFVTLPTHAHVDATESVMKYLENTQLSSTAMMPFVHTGMQKIMKLSPQCRAACQFQNLLIIQTPDDTNYEEVFDFFDMTGGLGRFNSHSLMWICYLDEDGVALAASFDDCVISEERVQILAHQFEKLVHVLCLEEDNRYLASLVEAQSGHPKIVSSHSPELTFATGQEVSSNGVSPLLATTKTGDNPAHSSHNPGQRLPQPLIEEELIQGVCNILGLSAEHIDLGSSFIAHGGDSIHALRLMASLKVEKIAIAVHDIMQPQSLSSLALKANRVSVNWAQRVSPVIPDDQKSNTTSVPDQITNHLSEQMGPLITNGSRNASEVISAIRPCTPTQKQILHSQKTNWRSYKSHTVFEVTAANMSSSALETAWVNVVSRHEIMRTIFLPTTPGSRESQIVLRNPELRIRHTSCGPEGPSESLSRIGTLQSTPLQPSHCFTTCTGNNGALSFRADIDHVLSDGPSYLLIMHELNELLHCNEIPSPSKLGPFLDHQAAVDRSESLVYWQEYLRNTTHCQLWGTLPSIPSIDFHTLSFDMDIAERSSKFCRKLQITSSTLIRLVWALVLRDISCSANVAFGYLVSSRDAAFDDMDQVMGPLFHVLPCNFLVKMDATAHDALTEMQKDSVDSLEHQMMPLPEVCESMGKDIGGKDYFSTLINHRRFAVGDAQQEAETCFKDLGTRDPMDYQLVLAVNETEQGIQFELTYWTPLVTHQAADEVAQAVSQKMTAIMTHEQSPLSELC